MKKFGRRMLRDRARLPDELVVSDRDGLIGIGKPLANGQCMLLSVMMSLCGIRHDDNTAALTLRRLMFAEIVINAPWYARYVGARMMREVLTTLVEVGANGRRGFCHIDLRGLLVIANIIRRPIAVIAMKRDVSAADAAAAVSGGDGCNQLILPLRSCNAAELPLRRLYLLFGNEDSRTAEPNHFCPLSDVDQNLRLRARAVSLPAAPLIRAFVNAGWCLPPDPAVGAFVADDEQLTFGAATAANSGARSHRFDYRSAPL